MNAVNQIIHLPVSLQREASRLAMRDGISLDQWVSMAVAQKIGSIETAAQFFQRRSQGAPTVDDALAVLNSGPDNPPEPGDELPNGYVPLSSR